MDQMTYRSVKGSGLTDDEIDTNFRLCFEKGVAVGLDKSFDVDPVTGGFSLGTTDDGSIGPIVVPAQPAASRGAWVTGRLYEPAEFVNHDGSLWQAVRRHQAGEVGQGTFQDDVAAGNLRLVFTGGGGLALPAKDGKSYLVKDQAYVEAPKALALKGVDGKFYVIKDDVLVEMPASTGGGGSGDGWIYETVSLTPGTKTNGLTYGQLVHHAATIFNADQRIIVTSKAANVSGVSVQVYCGPDQLMTIRLDGTVTQKLAGDFPVAANTPIDVRVLGGSPNLADVFTIRLAVRPAA